MKTRFSNRLEAGEMLATELKKYSNRPNALVLALPRGGVPVGFIVAQRLHLPFDVIVVRKIGAPGERELAIGALGAGGVQVMNEALIQALQFPAFVVDQVVAEEERELERRELIYCHGRPPPSVKNRTVILVDDGVATGATVRAAIAVLRSQGVGRLVVATPVMAPATFAEMQGEVDEIIAVLLPEEFYGVGQWYEDFSPTTDEEVQTFLESATHAFSPP